MLLACSVNLDFIFLMQFTTLFIAAIADRIFFLFVTKGVRKGSPIKRPSSREYTPPFKKKAVFLNGANMLELLTSFANDSNLLPASVISKGRYQWKILPPVTHQDQE
jgi:hypothetical protein